MAQVSSVSFWSEAGGKRESRRSGAEIGAGSVILSATRGRVSVEEASAEVPLAPIAEDDDDIAGSHLAGELLSGP